MITQSQLDSIERFADKLWAKVGLDIEFTRHFLDRLNDSRNKKDITPAEIQRLFKQSYRKYGKKIAALGQGAQAVINDMETDINMPFVLQLDNNKELDLVAKTVMRKKDFKTTNKKFTVESGAGEEGTDQLSYKYKKDTPGQSTNGKNMKKEQFVPTNIKNEDVADFMGAVSQAAAAGKKEFEFGGKTYKVTLKNKGVAKKIVKSMDEASDKELDIKSIEDLMKNPDARMIKQYGSKSKYLKMLKSKLDRLNEAAANDYANLSDKEISTMITLFRNVGRKAAAPILTALKRERLKRTLKEAAYPLYHPTFTAAAQAATDLAKKKGFEVDEDDWFNQVSTGPKKPGKGKTNRYIVKVTKGGKETKKRLAFQVYGMDSGKYELNAYVESTQIEEVTESTMDQVNAIISDKQAAKIGGKMIDMQTASVIAEIYNKVSGAAKKKMENEKIERLVGFAQQVMKKEDSTNNNKAVDLEEAILNRDIRHAIELLRLTPGATKFRDSLMKKDQDAKISSSDLKKAKELFANMSAIDSANVEKKRKDRYFPRFGVRALEEESTDLDEAIKWWTVTITKKAGKLFKGQTVDVKASNSAEAIKKGIKQMKGNPILVPSGSVDAVLGESIKEAAKPSNGKSTVGIDVVDFKAAMKDMKKFKLKAKEGKGNGSANEIIVTGKNADIFKYLTSDYYDMDTDEIEEFYPELYEGFISNVVKSVAAKFDDAAVKKLIGAVNDSTAIEVIIELDKLSPKKRANLHRAITSWIERNSNNAAVKQLTRLQTSLKESTDLEEATDTVDINTPTPDAAKRLAKKLANKWSELRSLTPKGKSVTVPNERIYIRYIERQPEFEGIAESVDLEETAATTQMVIKALKLKGGSKATALAQKLSAPEYVNAPLPKSVINTAKKLLKGQITKFVKEAADLEKTNVLSSDEYDEVQNFKNFNKRDWKWDKKKSLYVRKKKVNEAADLEEAASPFKSLEAAWLRTAGDEKKQARLIKKHNLKQIISKVRPGAIKLGVMNDLNAKGKQNYTAAGLDADGELIFVTNNPTKIYYPKSNSKRPEGIALESLEFARVKGIVERVTGVADVDFIVESEVNSSWTASSILNAYTKYKILNE
jgi:hypothetical protein